MITGYGHVSNSACMDKLRYKLNVSFLGASHSDGITAAAFSGHLKYCVIWRALAVLLVVSLPPAVPEKDCVRFEFC